VRRKEIQSENQKESLTLEVDFYWSIILVLNFVLFLWLPLRSLRNLRALCVQKIPFLKFSTRYKTPFKGKHHEKETRRTP
jgi:hypothetical protein